MLKCGWALFGLKLSSALSVQVDGQRMKPLEVVECGWVLFCLKLSSALSVLVDGQRMKPFWLSTVGQSFTLLTADVHLHGAFAWLFVFGTAVPLATPHKTTRWKSPLCQLRNARF